MRTRTGRSLEVVRARPREREAGVVTSGGGQRHAVDVGRESRLHALHTELSATPHTFGDDLKRWSRALPANVTRDAERKLWRAWLVNDSPDRIQVYTEPGDLSDFSPRASSTKSVDDIFVLYAGGVVHIPAGRPFFRDERMRPIVGFHGSYDPPRGML